MREVTIRVYKFSELGKSAQNRAIHNLLTEVPFAGSQEEKVQKAEYVRMSDDLQEFYWSGAEYNPNI